MKMIDNGKNRVHEIITVCLFAAVVFLIYRNNQLEQRNLHAERTLSEIETMMNLDAAPKSEFTVPDSLIPFESGIIGLFSGLSLERIGYIHEELNSIPHVFMLSEESCCPDSGDFKIIQINDDLGIPSADLIVCLKDGCPDRFFVVSGQNPWFLNMSLSVIRRLYE